ncbi:hypothetical protein L596_014712 [Steinernema carpocapsae]|nr:hypothetical protein L596_014712 [Steinernema carpocapsae]
MFLLCSNVLVIAVNRFVAIFKPFLYHKLFSNRTTFFFIAFVWGAAFAHVLPYFWDDCYIAFHTSEYLWKFAETPCGYVISQYTDFAWESST